MRERNSQPQERTYYKKLESISDTTKLRLRHSGKPKEVNRSGATLGEKFILYQLGNDYFMLRSLRNEFKKSVRYFLGFSIEDFLKKSDGEPYHTNVYERKREQDVDENIKPKP